MLLPSSGIFWVYVGGIREIDAVEFIHWFQGLSAGEIRHMSPWLFAIDDGSGRLSHWGRGSVLHLTENAWVPALSETMSDVASVTYYTARSR